MNLSCRTLAPLLILGSLSVAQMKDRATYLKEFERRADYITAPFDTISTPGYYQIAVKYARGRNIAQADSMFEVLLREPRGDMFWMFPVIGAYLHGKDKMSTQTNRSQFVEDLHAISGRYGESLVHVLCVAVSCRRTVARTSGIGMV